MRVLVVGNPPRRPGPGPARTHFSHSHVNGRAGATYRLDGSDAPGIIGVLHGSSSVSVQV